MRPKLNTRLDEGSALGDSTPDRERSKLRHTLFANPTFNCIHLSIPFDATHRPIRFTFTSAKPRMTTKHSTLPSITKRFV
jgi:hypothetical protein